MFNRLASLSYHFLCSRDAKEGSGRAKHELREVADHFKMNVFWGFLWSLLINELLHMF